MLSIPTTQSLIGVIILVLDVWAILSVLMGNSSIERKLLWVLVILLLPVLGILLYLVMGRSRLDAKVP